LQILLVAGIRDLERDLRGRRSRVDRARPDGGLTCDSHLGVALLVGVLVGNLVEAYGAVPPIIANGYSKRFAAG
jgi:hypothetical protein